MERKLIVVLTVSSHDWSLISRHIPPGGNIAYLDCDQGCITTPPIQALRVMVIANVQGRERDATDKLLSILGQYSEYAPVVGLHHRTYGFTTQRIDESRLPPDIAIDDKECTTAGQSSYSGLLDEIRKENPDLSKISRLFDSIIDAIQGTPQVHNKIYDLLAAFLPFHLELQLKDKSQLPDLASNLQGRRNALDQCLSDIGQLMGESNGQFQEARRYFEKLFQDVQSVQEIRAINFEDFHATYCNFRDKLLSCLKEGEV